MQLVCVCSARIFNLPLILVQDPLPAPATAAAAAAAAGSDSRITRSVQ